MLEAEVVVIGGGLAGASLATRLAEAGRNVLIVERESGPHDKVCGEFLSREAVLYLSVLGIDLVALGAVPIRSLSLAAGAASVVTGLPFDAMSLSRRILDEAVVARAATAGAQILRGRKVAGAVACGRGMRLRLEDGAEIDARTVFLATGKHDLRDHPRDPGRQNDLIGFKMMFRLAARQSAELHGRVELMLFKGGYAGLQPVEGGHANLCLVVRRDRFAEIGRRWPALLAAIGAETHALTGRLEGAEPLWAKPLTIAGLPYGLVVRRPDPDGLWRLGDQAAVIPSFSGDGMSIALHSAYLAASAYLAGQDARAFQARLAADVGAQVSRATWLSRIFVHRRPQQGLLTVARFDAGRAPAGGSPHPRAGPKARGAATLVQAAAETPHRRPSEVGIFARRDQRHHAAHAAYGRRHAIEPLVEDHRLLPEADVIHGDPQHVLDAAECARDVAGLFPTEGDIPLQADQHIPLAHPARKPGHEFSLGRGPRPVRLVDMRDHGVEILDVEDLPAGEHVKDGLAVVSIHTEDEMAWEVYAVAIPSCDLGTMQPDDTEADRHAAAPLRYPDQVDVLQVVVAVAVTAVVMPAPEHGGQRLRLIMRAAAGPVGQFRGFTRENAQMGAGTAPVSLGRVEPGEQQRCLRQRDFLIGQAPHRLKCGADRDFGILSALVRCGVWIGFVRQGRSPRGRMTCRSTQVRVEAGRS